jgi:hypothetical protein
MPTPSLLETPKRPASRQWKALEGIQGYSLGTAGKVWKAMKGWWASRKDFAGIQGPFRGYRLAQAWVEEPLAEEQRLWAEHKATDAEKKSQRQAEAREAKAARTWGALPEGQRELRPGQIWTHKAAGVSRQAMILDVRKATLVALFRSDDAARWDDAARDTLDPAAFLRLYRFQGVEPGPGKKKGKKA